MAEPQRPLRVLAIGLGAQGGLYSYLLSQSRRCELYCVARSNYASCLAKGGITIKSGKYGTCDPWRPEKIWQQGNAEHEKEAREVTKEEGHAFDYVLCSFKVLEEVVRFSDVLKPWLKELSPGEDGPTVVILQNGIGVEEEPYRNLVLAKPPRASVIVSGNTWIASNLKEQGTLVDHGSFDETELGIYPSPQGPNISLSPSASPSDSKLVNAEFAQSGLELLVDLFNAGGGTARAVPHIQASRIGKLLWNTSWGVISALSRQSVPQMVQPSVLPYVVGPVRRLQSEVLTVARACGITEEMLPWSAGERAFYLTYNQRPKSGSVSTSLAADFKPSITLDLEAGRPMELGPIIGRFVQLARIHNVDTPRLDMALACLRGPQVTALTAACGGELSAEEADAASHGDKLPDGRPVGLDW